MLPEISRDMQQFEEFLGLLAVSSTELESEQNTSVTRLNLRFYFVQSFFTPSNSGYISQDVADLMESFLCRFVTFNSVHKCRNHVSHSLAFDSPTLGYALA